MKRRDDGKASLVDFMRSIKFRHHTTTHQAIDVPTHFAHLNPQARPANIAGPEDCSLVRSAN
jgi:hypothetical protein